MRTFALTLLGLLCAAPAALADCTYTIRGHVKVRHQLDELSDTLGAVSPLENIQVKVSAKRKFVTWGWFSAWDTVRTDENGFFSVTRTKACAKRRFKVQVKFDDDDLELRHETATSSLTKVKWYTIHEQDSGFYKSSSTVRLGNLTFEAGGDEDLGSFEPRRHADIWVLYHMALDAMAGYGHPFTGKIKAKYPHDGVAPDSPEQSYANPLNNVIYIVHNGADDDGAETDTLLHELMHIWLYQHSTGEDALALYLATHLQRGTHDIVDRSYVAFHEGFAEYAAQVLLEDLFADPRPRPLSRTGLANNGLPTLDDVQFLDEGWESVFLTLALDPLDAYDFSTDRNRVQERGLRIAKTCDPVGRIGFQRLLRVMQAGAGYGDIGTGEMNLYDFFDRAADILRNFDDADSDLYLDLLDPRSDFEPYYDICDPIIMRTDLFSFGGF